MALFQRLIGLETEYALRIPQALRRADRGIHSHRDGYDAIVRSLGVRLPTARAEVAESCKEGVFLGTGGAVWFESLRPATGNGLIEGATPECRTPLELLACQRAQDRLLSQAAAEHGLALVKNCRDHRGNVYGAQENYEVAFAEGAALWFWQAAVWLCLVPLMALFGLGVAILLTAWLATLPVTAVIHLILRIGKTPIERERSFDFWIGRVWRKGWNGADVPCGGWISKPLLWGIMLAVAPLTAAMRILVELTRLGRLQRHLTAFLASRIVFAGAGGLDRHGRFQLAQKAGGIRRVAGIPEFGPCIFSLGQFLKPLLTVIRIGELWDPRQRVQIAIGDSNLCEEAEYLRVGTTLLVIEALEAGAITDIPRLARPLKALKAMNADPTLTTRVALRDGRALSALEIQRLYLDQCRDFVNSLPDVPEEAQDLLRRWDDVLRRLESDRRSLVGRIDWVTKQHLLDRTAGDAAPAVRRKIDVRYHELSAEGYFQLLADAGLHRRVLSEDEVSRAMRLPPGGTPATTRARLIREFAGPGLRVGWRRMSNGVRFR